MVVLKNVTPSEEFGAIDHRSRKLSVIPKMLSMIPSALSGEKTDLERIKVMIHEAYPE
jgi:hypothetical protein